MRAIIQRVTEASVTIDEKITGQINLGLLVLVGIEPQDSEEDASWLAKKIIQMRIFANEKGVPNLALNEVNGNVLIISQFTLFASTKKGNRPSYIRAARPEQAIPLYEFFIKTVQSEVKNTIQTGIFGADMKVSLLNDGPVTIFIDSKIKE
ncbi:MAG: hypothetical protein RI894_1379 [Bacteroidota bacterium]|jgi:D-tyrosyl-tRNA(Tyr) deacylase